MESAEHYREILNTLGSWVKWLIEGEGIYFGGRPLYFLIVKNMEYIVLLDYANGEVIKIRLSEEDTILANEAENYEDFLRTLEDKYHFRLDDCCWMNTAKLRERSYL